MSQIFASSPYTTVSTSAEQEFFLPAVVPGVNSAFTQPRGADTDPAPAKLAIAEVHQHSASPEFMFLLTLRTGLTSKAEHRSVDRVILVLLPHAANSLSVVLIIY